MKILILLGDFGKYLDYRVFQNEHELDLFIDKIHPLIMANIQRTEPLQKRLELVKDDYFLYAGAVTDFDIIDMEDFIPTPK
jgi:hypothetical protein